MRGIQPRTLTNRELIQHCANKLDLDLTTEGLPYEWQVELLRRFVMSEENAPERPLVQMRSGYFNKNLDPERD